MGFYVHNKYYDNVSGALQSVITKFDDWGIFRINYCTGYLNLIGCGNISVETTEEQEIIVSGYTDNLKKIQSFNILKQNNQITGVHYQDGRKLQIFRNQNGSITGTFDGISRKQILYDNTNSITGVNVIYY